ncbi:MAG: hypothetical protein V1781_05960 [Bacteroidota bacterium]
MNVLICFEVSDKQEAVKKELLQKGYMSSWKAKRGKGEITCYLPFNSVWKKGENMGPTAAKEDLKKTASQMGVKIIRALAISVSGKWDGVVGTPSNGNT